MLKFATAQEVFTVAVQTPFRDRSTTAIAYAKANPGKLNYGSGGIGSSAHLATALFESDVTGAIKLQHVPYSQMAQGITDVLTGRTEVTVHDLQRPAATISKSGAVRAFLMTGPKRAALLPDLLPGMTELGIKMGEESSWYAFFAPKGTPRPIIDKINRDLEAIAEARHDEREAQQSYRFIGGSPDKLAAFLKSETAKWDDLGEKKDRSSEVRGRR